MKKQRLSLEGANPFRIIYIICGLTVPLEKLYNQINQSRALRTFYSVVVDIFSLLSIFALGYMWLVAATFFS